MSKELSNKKGLVKNISKEQAISTLEKIVEGIESEEHESDNGWWETSAGKEFGKSKLKELIDLITLIYGE